LTIQNNRGQSAGTQGDGIQRFNEKKRMMESGDRVKKRMREHIEWICEKIGPRPPCGDGEKRAADYIKAYWEQSNPHTFCENFTCHPDAYRAAFRWPIGLFILSLCLYHLLPLLAFLLSAIAMLILVLNMMLNRELIDPLFPPRESQNVISRFEPRGAVERTVIVSCHHDSHYAFPIVNRFGRGFGIFMMVVVLSSASLLILCFLKALFLWPGLKPLLHPFRIMEFPVLILLTATVPVHLYTFLRFISDQPVPGANDNLSGVAVCMALSDHLAREENRHRRTRVWLVSFGCEEIGIRGSKRFVKRHWDEIRDAWVLNLDMVGEAGTTLQAVTKEEVNLIRLSRDMVHQVLGVAERIGVPLRSGPVAAFTDAMAFAVKGIKATTLMGLDDKGTAKTYHSMEDTPDRLDDDLLLSCYEICKAFIQHVDVMDAQSMTKQESF